MKSKIRRKTKPIPLFWVPLLFFGLGLFNMMFAYLGFICMALPFILLAKNKQKTWCQRYCPRAELFNVLFRGRSLTGKAAPAFLTGPTARKVFFAYFMINFMILLLSTVMVGIGRVEALTDLRFLMAFRLPFSPPQVLLASDVPSWLLHMPYRIYSMMMTTTVIGLLLGWIYKPRTWCTICPVGTASNLALKKGF